MQKSFEIDRNCDISVLSNVWHHALINELRIQPEEHELIITDQPGGSIRSKHNFVHLIFEHFNFRGASIVDSVLLATYIKFYKFYRFQGRVSKSSSPQRQCMNARCAGQFYCF